MAATPRRSPTASAVGTVAATLPRALRRGDAVAVVSPCGPVLDHDLLADGIAVVRSWGLDVVEVGHVRAATGHVAGSDAQRTAALNAAIADPAVRAVWVTRGGYGLTRILDRVDWATLAADPRILVGFSDVTALFVAAWRRIGLVGVHGHFVGRLAIQPVAARERLRALLFGEVPAEPLTGVPLPGVPARVVRAPLVGGNLTVLAALAGTPDRVDAAGCVLLLEEVGEAPYRVDRLLTQLRHSDAFAGVVGVAVGAPVRCEPPVDRPSATFAAVLADRLGDLDVPVVTDLPIGHMPEQRAVLHGGAVTLDGAAGRLACHDRLAVAHVPAERLDRSAVRRRGSGTV
ncbi:MAG: LD-carboxypeptidase [Actinobacteria bacterium]|nr:LD-carboxypeptidase [Actinomycetota bacterium]